MTPQIDLGLNSWLQRADEHYIDGRHLWLNRLTGGSCVLLSLAIEQMMKILIIRAAPPMIGSEASAEEVANAIGGAAKGIERFHSLKRIAKVLNSLRPDIDIAPYMPAVEKLDEFFKRRYVVHESTSIALRLIHVIDALFFYLRSHVSVEVGMSTIEEIATHWARAGGHPLPAFASAYYGNVSFMPRPMAPVTFFDLTANQSFTVTYSDWQRPTPPEPIY